MCSPKTVVMVGLIGISLCCSTSGQAADTSSGAYRYRVDYTFGVRCESERLLEILFTFDHLQRFMTDVKSLEKSHEGPTSYWVTYRYQYFVYKSTLVFLKTLNKNKNRIEFRLLFGHDNVDFLPELLAVDGFYEIKELGHQRVAIVYHQSSQFDDELGFFYRHILANRTVKFLKNLHTYIEERACPQ